MNLRLLVLFSILFLSIPGFAKPVDFKWKEIKVAVKYQVEVSAADDFDSPIVSEFVTKASIIKELEPGTYYMRVRAYAANDKRGKWSQAKKVIVTNKIEKPVWKLDQEEWSSGKKVELEWSGNTQAQLYKVRVLKKNSGIRSPSGEASELTVVQSFETRDTQFTLPSLPEGEYKVTVEAASGLAASEKSETNIVISSLDLLKVKKADLEFGGGYGYYNYSSQLSNIVSPTSIKSAQSYKIYGRALVNLSQSSWKLDLRSSMTTFSFQGGSVLASDIQLAPGVSSEIGLCASCRVFVSIGPKLWTTPYLSRTQIGNGSVMESSIQTFLGPVLNTELQSNFGRYSTATIYSSVSTPLAASSGGRDDIGKSRVESTINYKAGMNLLTPITNGYAARLGVEYESQNIELTKETGSAATTQFTNTNFLLGLHSTVGAHEENKNLFSDFEFSLGVSYDQGTLETKSLHYSGRQFERTDEYGLGFGYLIRGQGWFKDSNSGLRAEANWKTYGSDGRHHIGFSDYLFAWRYRLSGAAKAKSSWENYFGFGTHTLPIIFEDSSYNKSVSSTATLGVVEGLAYTRYLTNKMWASWLAEVYYPLTLLGKSGGIKQMIPTPSYKSELQVTSKFGSVVGITVGIGYKFDEIRYTSDFSGSTDFKTIQRAPYLSLLGTFGF